MKIYICSWKISKIWEKKGNSLNKWITNELILFNSRINGSIFPLHKEKSKKIIYEPCKKIYHRARPSSPFQCVWVKLFYPVLFCHLLSVVFSFFIITPVLWQSVISTTSRIHHATNNVIIASLEPSTSKNLTLILRIYFPFLQLWKW